MALVPLRLRGCCLGFESQLQETGVVVMGALKTDELFEEWNSFCCGKSMHVRETGNFSSCKEFAL